MNPLVGKSGQSTHRLEDERLLHRPPKIARLEVGGNLDPSMPSRYGQQQVQGFKR